MSTWKQLQAPVRKLLQSEWNPIPGAAEDEYDAYVLQVVGKIVHGASATEIADYLTKLDGELMGPPERTHDHHALAAKLAALREET